MRATEDTGHHPKIDVGPADRHRGLHSVSRHPSPRIFSANAPRAITRPTHGSRLFHARDEGSPTENHNLSYLATSPTATHVLNKGGHGVRSPADDP